MSKLPTVGWIVTITVAVASCTTPQVKEGPQQSADPIYFSRSVPYQEGSRVKAEIVAECEIEENVLTGIDERSMKNGLPLTDQASSRKLTVEIMHATSGVNVLGNFLSEPATLSIAFRVTEGEKVLLAEDKLCKTNLAGFLGSQPSACNKIEKCARSNGEYLSERISRVLYQ